MGRVSPSEAAHWFSYEPESGHLLWARKRKGRGCVVGAEAGTVSVKGYRVVGLKQKKHFAHNIIWSMMRGVIPEGMYIDHIDGNTLNNRLENLRLVSASENQRNQRIPKSNTTGEMCVSAHKPGFYQVQVAGKYFGRARSIQEAVKIRDRAFKLMGCHENHGRK